MADTLFGMMPEDIQAQRQAAAQAQAMQFAKMGPAEQVNYGGYMAGNQLGTALGGMMGAKDPVLERATAVNQLVQETDMNDLEAVKALTTKLMKVDPKSAMSLLPRIDALTKTQEDRTARKEDKQASIAAKKEELQMRFESDLTKLRENNASKAEQAELQRQFLEAMKLADRENRLTIAQIMAAVRTNKPEVVDDKLGTAISVLEQQAPLIKKAQDMRARIEKNPEYLTMSGRAGGFIDSLTGTNTPALTLQSDLKAFQSKARNAYLLLAKGTQTEGDAQRAWDEFAPTLDWTTPEGAKRSMDRSFNRDAFCCACYPCSNTCCCFFKQAKHKSC